MTDILDRVARVSKERSQFRPATTDEFFALRLAVRLNDAPAARHYSELTQRYSQKQILEAYARALAFPSDPARRFHRELKLLTGNTPGNGKDRTLAAIRIERRAVGVAILAGDQLKFADARQASSSPEKAVATAMNFIGRVCQRFRFESVALEAIPKDCEVQRAVLREAVLRILRPQVVGIAEVSEPQLIAGFAFPPLRFRRDLRETISAVYPALVEGLGVPWTLDAAALALYVQTEHLFETINLLRL
jgi:hypothetical protein